MSVTSHVISHTATAFHWVESEIIHLYRFIQQPICRRQCVTDRRWAVRAIFLSLLVVILLTPFVYFINSLQEFLGIAESQPTATANPATFFSVVFFAPLIEEGLFRSGLRNPICSLVLAPVVAIAFLINSEQHLLVFAIFLMIIALLTVAHWNLFFGDLQARLRKLHARKFKIIFWANCFYFSCAHLNNFQLSGTKILLFWIVITPQLLFAIVFSYLRLRDGIKSAILSHATINIVAVAAYSIPSS